jgi:hypothetical protein
VDDPSPAPLGQVTALDEVVPGLLIGAGDEGADVLEQDLVDVRPAEVGVPARGERPAGPHDGHVDRPTPDVEDGDGPVTVHPRKAGGVEDRGGNGFRHQHHPRGKPVASLPKDPGPDGPPLGGMGEHELVDGLTTNPLPLGHRPGKDGPDDVPHLVHGGAEQQLVLIDPPLGMRLVTGGIDGGLPIGLLPNEEGPVIGGVDRGRHERRTIDRDDLRLPPTHRHRDARTGRPEVDRHPQCHPHPR